MAGARKRMNAALIRQLNVARVFHALRLQPDATQRQLARSTGLDKATISTVVAALEQDGLLQRSTQAVAGRVGRPEVSLRIAEGAGLLVGARLEPSAIRLIVTDLSGHPKCTHQVPGSIEVGEAQSRLVAGVRELLAACGADEANVKGIGVGVPALMSAEGRLAFAPNLGWRDVAIRPALADRFAAPVYVDNDTKAAGLAEKLFGSCQAVDDFVFISGHSGIGAGLYLDGSMYRGGNGFAGELGHVKVRRGGRACGCGGRGCLESYVSELAIVQRLREAGSPVHDLRSVAELAESGDPLVIGLLEETGSILGDACADLVNMLNPTRIVIGGNLTLVAPYVVPAMRAELERHALRAPLEACAVEVSPLGTESVTMGGIALAMEGVLSLPTWLAASEIRDAIR